MGITRGWRRGLFLVVLAAGLSALEDFQQRFVAHCAHARGLHLALLAVTGNARMTGANATLMQR
ncbi:hypothetical protein LMG27952_02126 [Paraburkholderia hiiakae]|uniref:Uncharacterized protein n=1 Tax=Paraburkholderia hiiakae TaxID=1081782 RepID=A0ABM8NIX1_9BURK|nr:hypothetical protein [Paraburkholderia hiiakae]CAD6528043.1 hypothetical protein LMG27952_02126 [Paraburkholderia hiiakae]